MRQAETLPRLCLLQAVPILGTKDITTTILCAAMAGTVCIAFVLIMDVYRFLAIAETSMQCPMTIKLQSKFRMGKPPSKSVAHRLFRVMGPIPPSHTKNFSASFPPWAARGVPTIPLRAEPVQGPQQPRKVRLKFLSSTTQSRGEGYH
jgi:hypothetical protein